MAKSIEDVGKKKSVFLAVIGLTTYSLLRNLVSPLERQDIYGAGGSVQGGFQPGHPE